MGFIASSALYEPSAEERLVAYKRDGRPSLYFMGLTETGRKQLSTGTANRVLARSIEAAWNELATQYRAWDVLGSVLSGAISIGRLFDAWTAANHSIADTRRRLSDVDLTPIVAEWFAIYRRTVKPDSAQHALVHVRQFFPADRVVLASSISTEGLSKQLNEYAGKRNTLRKVHSSLTVFLRYCTDVKGIFLTNPMARVPRPPVESSPIKFYDIEVVERIIVAQPTQERRVLFSLLYGTAIEVSVALRLTRADIDFEAKTIRAAGTKAHSRDRVCRVADWAWAIVAGHARNVLPSAPIFPAHWDRHTVSDWHRQTVGIGTRDRHGKILVPGLCLEKRYPLHSARDHWAVRAMRAGTPLAVVAAQLGHGSPMLTLTKYGRFAPSAADRDRWEAAATQYDERLRVAR